MPLLLCPNDNASMQTVQRQGVEFDMCPQCRGVWLDRGELEKLMQSEPGAAPASSFREAPVYQEPPRYEQPRYDERRRDDDDDNRRRQSGYENRPYQKKRESWWSEIFD